MTRRELIALSVGTALGAFAMWLALPSRSAREGQPTVGPSLGEAPLPMPVTGSLAEASRVPGARTPKPVGLPVIRPRREIAIDIPEVPASDGDWPPELPEEFRPAAMAAALARLREICPERFPADSKLDCSVFPCAIFVASFEDEPRPDLAGCPAMETWLGRPGKLHLRHRGVDVMSWVPKPQSTGGQLERRFDAAKNGVDFRRKRFARDHSAVMCEEEAHPEACAYIAAELRDEDVAAARRFALTGCEANGSEACLVASDLTAVPDEVESLRDKSCELGSAMGCQRVARALCSFERCDEAAIGYAQKAVAAAERNRDDVDGSEAMGRFRVQSAYHTLGRMLCQLGRADEAVAAFKGSCDNGSKRDCERVCDTAE